MFGLNINTVNENRLALFVAKVQIESRQELEDYVTLTIKVQTRGNATLPPPATQKPPIMPRRVVEGTEPYRILTVERRTATPPSHRNEL